MPEPFSNFFNHPFLGRGFRPFFLLGALYSVISLLIWSRFYMGSVTLPSFMFDPVSWHAHEMIYGFTMAIVAGFLLTAVANWTGGAPARQMHLGGLCVIWLAGRVVMNFDLNLDNTTIIVIEGAFIPALVISLAIPLLKSWNKRNFVFLVLLSALLACDIVFLITETHTPLYIAVMVVITMISLIGGRIIPAFTVAALRRRGEEAFQTPQRTMDILALISLFCIIFSLILTGTQGLALGIAAFISAIIHTLRMRHYHTLKILNDPMVWILHIGYAWVIVGLFLMSFSALNILTFSIALHVLTVGAIGSMVLGMICRVTLGHTGRNLVASKFTIFSFILMQIAVFLRVLGPVLISEQAILWIVGSAMLWAICFGLYILIYTPMLWQQRPDGKTA